MAAARSSITPRAAAAGRSRSRHPVAIASEILASPVPFMRWAAPLPSSTRCVRRRIPKTTFTVGVVSGGTSVNAIAGEAEMRVDMRSNSASELANIERQMLALVDEAVVDENQRWNSQDTRVETKLLGDRPAGTANSDTPSFRRPCKRQPRWACLNLNWLPRAPMRTCRCRWAFHRRLSAAAVAATRLTRSKSGTNRSTPGPVRRACC